MGIRGGCRGGRTNFSKGVVRAVVEDGHFADGMEYCMLQK